MSYYKGEEVIYIGSINSQNGNGDFESDINTLVIGSIGTGNNVQYYCSLSISKGDILYLINHADFPQGGYFKFSMTCTFSSSFYSNVFDAKSDLFNQIYNQTGDYVVYGGQSIYCDYLGEAFSLDELTDELPTPQPTVPPSTEVLPEVPSSGGNYSDLVIDNAEAVINNTSDWVFNLFAIAFSAGLVIFCVVFSLKKSISFFKSIGRGGH